MRFESPWGRQLGNTRFPNELRVSHFFDWQQDWQQPRNQKTLAAK